MNPRQAISRPAAADLSVICRAAYMRRISSDDQVRLKEKPVMKKRGTEWKKRARQGKKGS